MPDERRPGSLKLGSNIEPRVDAPLDARAVVPTIAALTDAGNWPYLYVGMVVAVQATGQVFVLTGDPDEPDPTDAANWRELGAGGSGGGDILLEAGEGIKITQKLNSEGQKVLAISLDLKLESESDQLTIKEIES